MMTLIYYAPTALLSIMPWALLFAADIVAGLVARLKKLRTNDAMVAVGKFAC